MDNKLTLKDQKGKWYPAPISSLENHLRSFIIPVNDFPQEKTYPLVKNLAYTLQYIEFLNQVICDMNLSDVLEKQNIKSFVIHGASVIESIFQYLVVSSGNGTMTDWQSIKKLTSNTYLINQSSFKNETEIFIKIDLPVIKEMSFDQLAKKVESKKLLGDAEQLYAEISLIRKLRNKVHLHGIESMFDTDYNNFDKAKFNLMRRVLYGLLTSSIFSNSKHGVLFNYLLNS